MATHSRHKIVGGKQQFADAKKLARMSPTRWPETCCVAQALRTAQQRRELWHLLQDLGGDNTVKRAAQTIEYTRSSDELDAAARAAGMDLWYEVARR